MTNSTLTTNQNFLSPLSFTLSIDATKFANLQYYCTGATLPGLDIASAEAPYRGNIAQFTGDRVTYSDLEIKFNVLEGMENYIETHQWILDMLTTNETETYDATLNIYSSKNNVTNSIQLLSCFPTSLSPLEFDAKAEFAYLDASATFKFTTFKFI
jgi:hypothetical protein